MTAIATVPVMNDQESEKNSRVDHSPSRFTAVNGKDSLTEGLAGEDGSPRSGENREPTEAWPRPAYDRTARHEDTLKENGNTGNDIDETQSKRSTPHGSLISSNRVKRRRSESDEPEGSRTPYHGPKSPVYPAEGIAEHSPREGTTNGIMSSQSDTDSKRTSPQTHARPEEGEITRRSSTNTSWHEYDAQLLNQAQRVQQIDASDAQLAEALQREAQGPDAVHHKTWDGVNHPIVEGSIPSEQPPTSSFPQDRSQNAVQVAPKRKRVFSNRTKTGCMTCRRRKKKCDEQHPAFLIAIAGNNCLRGGFICEGYSSRSTWQKPSSSKTPVPLQSKEGYPDTGGHYIHDSNQHDRQKSLGEPLDAGKMRSMVVDDDNRPTTQFNTSPTGVGSSRGSWPKRTWSGANHTSYIADSLPKSDFREVPSIHELSREGHTKGDYPLVPPIRELSHGGHTKPNVPLFQGGIDQRPAHTSSIDTSTPQAQARMALSIEHQLSGRAVSNEETEKDKMLRGDLYRPFDVILVEERERCRAALWRFNNACNPVSGLSTKEQNRLLKEILVPQTSINSPLGTASPRPAGSIAQGAVVEAPFQCHYGYNVHIGEDVMISESCLFVDDCSVTIGAHTWIGPRVTILTSMAHANMQERKGSQSRYQGRPVTIEEDCYVGAGCTIYPGVRLRRGAYVAPGEVVKTDIVAYGFQGLKPSYM
ncbi:putative Zn(II)2Cys6 transcription factor [Aspergillus mulundensis]|uniref:Putative Zn(II)2Cys6 transcription factor n=1 Tax=Aspergillus mulundensis TaxID=1810919 RepID=A0A3D8SCA5_9EURO|nr:putative Zn(II)2Cys6 transcription factor [Aspergillus mulundensis]RDW83977.1 putative Zn(II)2Cys6 transcription factor [Aspergillus mulundensis]